MDMFICTFSSLCWVKAIFTLFILRYISSYCLLMSTSEKYFLVTIIKQLCLFFVYEYDEVLLFLHNAKTNIMAQTQNN
jgi:hypothetical protein